MSKLLDKKSLEERHPGLKRNTIEWLCRTRQIPIVKIGRRIFFDEMEILKWIDSNKVNGIGIDK